MRQGNLNPKVKIFRYVTEGTFDSYSWQLIENKQKFIGQIMTSKSPVRSCEDVDEAALTYAEVKALATGNPYIKEKMDLDIQVSRLKLMKGNHTSQKYKLEDNIAKHYPQQIAILKERISGMEDDIQTAKANLPADKEQFLMKVGDKFYTDKKEAGATLVEMCKEMKTVNVPATIGEYAGFKMAVSFDSFNHKFVMNLKGQLSHNLEVGSDPLGNIARINHALESMPKQLAEAQKTGNGGAPAGNRKSGGHKAICTGSGACREAGKAFRLKCPAFQLLSSGSYKVTIDLAWISGYNGIEVIYLLGMAFAFPIIIKEVYG